MSLSDRDRLSDARDHLTSALAATGSAGVGDLWSDRVRRQSLIFDLIILGEALTKVSPEVKATVVGIPWRMISDTRNHLIHAHWLQDRDFVEELMNESLPPLLEALGNLVASMGEGT